MPDFPLLIAVTDVARLAAPLEEWAAEIYRGGVDIIQVRAPEASRCDLAAMTKRVVTVAPGPERVQVNGDPKIAGSLKCGLHLPERFPPIRPPYAPASRSVHSVESVRASAEFDFVVAGHIFATPSKPGEPPRGLDWLRQIVAESPVPVVAIGGIDQSNAASVLATGAAGVAVIGALTPADDPRPAAAQLRAAIDDAWERRRTMQDATGSVEIQLNGKPAHLAERTSILDLLEQRELTERLVVVEINGEIVPRSAFGETVFAAGDIVEIVHFVGGG